MSQIYTTRRAAARRLSWFILVSIGVVLMVVLYFIKTQSQTMRKSVTALEVKIAQEQAHIKVLGAELAVLGSPQRLSQLAQEHLELAPMRANQSINLAQIEEHFPRKPEVDTEPRALLSGAADAISDPRLLPSTGLDDGSAIKLDETDLALENSPQLGQDVD